MTNSEKVIDIIKTAAEAIRYGDNDNTVMFKTMQLWEVDARTNEFTFPLLILDRPLSAQGAISTSGIDVSKNKVVLYIFTNIVDLNAFIEDKGPLSALAEELKELLIQKLLTDDRVRGSVEYQSEEILESVLNEHNPCGLWMQLTIQTHRSVPC